MKNNLDKWTNKGSCILLFIISLIFILPMSFFQKGVCVSDELGYLSYSEFFKGNDWSTYISTIGLGNYKWGITILYYPLYALINNRKALYIAILCVNSILLSIIPCICFLCYRVNNKKNIKDSMKYSILTGMLPCLILWSNTALADCFLAFISWIVLFLFILFSQTTNKYELSMISLAIGGVSVYAYAVHVRGIAITLTAFLVLLYNNIRYEKKINFWYYLGGALVILKVDYYFTSFIKPKIWTIESGYNTTSSFLSGYENVDVLVMIKSLISSTVGTFFSVNAYSFGIAFLGMCFTIYSLFAQKRKKQIDVLTELFVVLQFAMQFAISIAFLAPGVYKILNGESNLRNDQLIYCRYIAVSIQMFVFMFYLYFHDYKNKRIKWISVLFLFMTNLLFLLFIYNYFSEGSVAWLQISGIFLWLKKINGVLISAKLFYVQLLVIIIVQVVFIGIILKFKIKEKIWQPFILLLSIINIGNWFINGYMTLTNYYYDVLDEASDFCTKYIDNDTKIMFDMDRGWYAAQYILSDYDIVLRQEDYSEIIIFGEEENLSNYVGKDYFVVQDYDNSIVVKGIRLATVLEEKGLTLYGCE